jgi:hypothetical protein
LQSSQKIAHCIRFQKRAGEAERPLCKGDVLRSRHNMSGQWTKPKQKERSSALKNEREMHNKKRAQ